MKVIIDRSRWARGKTDEGPTRYLCNNVDGHCCLGFDAIACGVPPRLYAGVSEPSGIYDHHMECVDYKNAWMKKASEALMEEIGTQIYPSLQGCAIHVNDSTTLSDEERERLLVKVFAEAGRELVFEGEYASNGADGAERSEDVG